MSLRRTGALAFALAAGCGPHSAPEVSTASAAVDGELTFSMSSATMADQELPWRMIVRRDSVGSGCATVGYWSGAKLFSSATDDTLKRYCVYTWTGTHAPSSPPLRRGDTYDMDRLAVTGMGTYGKPSVADLAAETVDQLDPIGSYTSLPSHKAWLGVLDTVRTLPVGTSVYTASSFDSHGNQVASLAQRALCDDNPGSSPTCSGRVTSRNAIAWVRNGSGDFVEPANGGTIGSQADVASAIYEEVKRWETYAAPNEQLVLNLSLGWHPSVGGGGAPGSMPIPVRATYDALRYASCNGALVLAAAGHEDTPEDGAKGTGPLYPAAWEALAAPDGTECAAAFPGTSPTASTLTTYERLVYAVGAVDRHENPIVITRPDSMPLRAAAGSHLASFHGTGLKPVTGTSAATAVVSAAATAARTLQPSLSPHDIMSILYDSGADTGVTAEFCDTTSCTDNTHVVSICAAVAAAADGTSYSGNYPTTACGTSSSTLTVTADPAITPTAPSFASHATCGADGIDVVYYDTSANTVACPVQEEPSSSALSIVRPMPDTDPCPWCPVQIGIPGPGGIPPVVILSTTEDLGGFENMSISIYFEGGGEPDHYNLPPMWGMDNVVELPANALDDRVIGTESLPVTGATFDYMRKFEPYSYSNPLYLEF